MLNNKRIKNNKQYYNNLLVVFNKYILIYKIYLYKTHKKQFNYLSKPSIFNINNILIFYSYLQKENI